VWHLLVSATGYLKSQVGNQSKSMLHRSMVGDQVILLGHLDHPTLTQLEWAQLAILPLAPSLWVGDRGGTSLWLPVVSYEAGSVPEVVKKMSQGG